MQGHESFLRSVLFREGRKKVMQVKSCTRKHVRRANVFCKSTCASFMYMLLQPVTEFMPL